MHTQLSRGDHWSLKLIDIDFRIQCKLPTQHSVAFLNIPVDYCQ